MSRINTSRIKFPKWMRDEVSALVEKQMHMARTLAVRLVDPDMKAEFLGKGHVPTCEVVAAVQALDALCKQLDALVGGTPSFAQDPDDYRTAVAFAHYCERAIAYKERAKRRR